MLNEVKCSQVSCGCIVDCQVQLKYENEFGDFKAGMVLSSVEYPVGCSNLIRCEVVTLELDLPMIKGQ